MKNTEIRVRPVIRHSVTRYTRESHPDGMESGGCESLGEFANEAYAEEVAAALRTQEPKPMQYAAVERNHFDIATYALYFDVEADALAYAEHAKKYGREFRVFSREITDPVKKAHHEMGMISYGFPGGIDQVELPPALPLPPEIAGKDSQG